jgi:hypothetical protein
MIVIKSNAEHMANEMINLLTQIESDRLKYTEKRDALKRAKDRMEKVELEITDERAELVATAGLLNQNDKIREQIQQEEREKMKIEFDKELKGARQKLAEQRANMHGAIRGELDDEMKALKSEIAQYQSILKIEEEKNEESVQRHEKLQQYADDLEQRLGILFALKYIFDLGIDFFVADSEVAQEFSQTEIDRLNEENQNKSITITNLMKELVV